MARVTFRFEDGKETEDNISEGASLLDAAKKMNINLDAPCNGSGTCGKCKVRILSGMADFSKGIYLTETEIDSGIRLACQTRVTGDVVVLVPDAASAYLSRIKSENSNVQENRKSLISSRDALSLVGLSMQNNLSVLSLTLQEPSMQDSMPDSERFLRAVKEKCGCLKAELSYYALRKLSKVLRASGFSVKAVVRRTGESAYVLDLFSAKEEVKLLGAAIDIGTTTVSAILTDLSSGEILSGETCGNAQIRYGADVINRIIEQEKEGGIERLQNALINETLNPLLMNMYRNSGADPSQIYRISIAANTTMNHLLLGVDAGPIRKEPYIPSFYEVNQICAKDLGLAAFKEAEVFLTPNVGSYVGGDITAGTLSSLIWTQEEYFLLVDLGTNGELVFGNSEFLVCCACSAGPAFEGGDISCGMRATDGAIEACKINPDSMEPEIQVIGGENQKPAGICGSGLIDLIAELFTCNIISPNGKFVREGERICRDEFGMARFILVESFNSASGKEISITETDIDNLIRAKGAVFSAIRVLMRDLDLDFSAINHVYVAGGIGSGINIHNAVTIGMFPDIGEKAYSYIGNSSLSGAYEVLLSDEANDKVRDLARSMTYLELSTEPGYMEEFVAACFLPHTSSELFPSVVRRSCLSQR